MITLCACALWPPQTSAQNDSALENKIERPAKVLIVHENSYLENAVTAILSDSLSLRGFAIKTISSALLNNEQSESYAATIIFNAVKASGLSGEVRSFARTLATAQSNILICTVRGEEWKSGKLMTDAVAAATKTLNPGVIAARIIGLFDSLNNPTE
jgi:DNA-binding response OmpR family regulator